MIADYKHTHTQKPPKSKKPTDQLKKKKGRRTPLPQTSQKQQQAPKTEYLDYLNLRKKQNLK